jgi:hypothetical protein
LKELTTENRIEVSLLGVLLAFFLCSLSLTCQGALVEMDVSDLWCEADVVLIGDVLNITTHQGDKGTIYRNVVVEVKRYNKNPLNMSQVNIHVLGGAIGNIAQGVEDQPEFNVGETVLVFLAHHTAEPPYHQEDGYHVVNGPQGKFTVADGVATNIAGDRLELTGSLGLPALFVVSDLGLFAEVEEGSEITIFVNVSNVGEVEGAYKVDLKIEGEVAYSEDVTLAGGETKEVPLWIMEGLPEGAYHVEVNGLEGSFEVVHAFQPTGMGRTNLLPQVILSTILLIGLLLIGFLLIMRLVVHRRAQKADADP